MKVVSKNYTSIKNYNTSKNRLTFLSILIVEG